MRDPHRARRAMRLVRTYAQAHATTCLDFVKAYRTLQPTLSYRSALADLALWIRCHQRTPGIQSNPIGILVLAKLV